MKSGYTDVTLVVDRSGSMSVCKDDAEGGVNAFIIDQAKQPGECTVTLIEFDDTYDIICEGTPVRDVNPYRLRPRGMTALLDAVGKAINATGLRLSHMDEADRPELVAFVICTDGGENASKEFAREQIREMITRQQEQWNWKFTFLGANQDAFVEGGSLGIDHGSVANFDVHNTSRAYKAASAQLTNMRMGASEAFDYSDAQRRSMK